MRIYEWLSARPAAKWWILSATLLLLTLPLINLQYKENIAEFIPQSGNYLERMEVFQQMSSADKTFVLFSIKNEAQEQKAPLDAQEQNAPLLAEAVDLFAERLAAADSSHLVKEIVKEVDYERYKALIPFIYSHIPYLLSAEEKVRESDELRDCQNRFAALNSRIHRGETNGEKCGTYAPHRLLLILQF